MRLFGKKKKEPEEQGRIRELEQRLAQAGEEKLSLRSQLADAQAENNAQQTEYEKLRDKYERLEKSQQSIFKTAELQVQKEVTAAREQLEQEYAQKLTSLEHEIAELENKEKELNSELGRKLDELSSQKREYREKLGERAADIKKLEQEISQLNKALEDAKEAVTKRYSKVEQRMKQIANRTTVTILEEGKTTQVRVYEQVYEGRRSSGYNAFGPNGEKIYVRTARCLPIGSNILVEITSMPKVEARPMDNPDVELKVDETF
jgi:chromosome segregation ATPase